jgi:hypothetical protein
MNTGISSIAVAFLSGCANDKVAGAAARAAAGE